ncbi:hypothetical protein [Streptomyces sp. NBC_01481]|uniref:hypothetical protein n=1 Tax=Streptomyces sp. NBC_01481 TaxID=2975869 RepID=UPI002253BF96|nr:hypothetical protein [Streptomyces sp. NBC_01481]MCX4586227.1 hypothetical protein [Streptomyces sp. NBC_01481]
MGALCLLLSAAGVAGCGEQTVVADIDPGPSVRVAAPDGGRARQVSDAWKGSQAARQWRDGFFSLDLWIQEPQYAFRNGEDKVAFGNRNFDLEGSLPGKAGKGTIRWEGGGSLAAPLKPAQQVFEQLDGDAPGGADGDDDKNPLIVTGAKLGEITMATSRGPARVPAWFFTLKGYDTPLKHVALGDSMRVKSPVKPLESRAQTDDLMPLQGLKSVAKDGRSITLSAGHGSCDEGPAVKVLQTGDNVVLSASIINRAEGACASILFIKEVTVKLDRPLGDRILLDAFSGAPVIVESPDSAKPVGS